MSSESVVIELSAQLKELKGDVDELKRELASVRKARDVSDELPLRVFISRVGGDRKPFSVSIEGPLSFSQRLSPIRTAILIVLLADLRERMCRGRGLLDIEGLMGRVQRQLEGLDPTLDDTLIQSVRAAFHRFATYCNGNKAFQGKKFSLLLSSYGRQINLVHSTSTRVVEKFTLEIFSEDPEIAVVLDRFDEASPLAQLRDNKLVFLPGGPGDGDNFMLEIHNRQVPTECFSMYFRPSIQMMPESLISKIGIFGDQARRQNVFERQMMSNRLRVTDILPGPIFWDMISCTEDGRFPLYPPGVGEEEVRDLLSNLERVIHAFKNYNLVLSPERFSTYLATFSFDTGDIPELLSMTFMRSRPKQRDDEDLMATQDPRMHQQLSVNYVQHIVNDPKATTSKREVLKKLAEVRNYLDTRGPVVLPKHSAVN